MGSRYTSTSTYLASVQYAEHTAVPRTTARLNGLRPGNNTKHFWKSAASSSRCSFGRSRENATKFVHTESGFLSGSRVMKRMMDGKSLCPVGTYVRSSQTGELTKSKRCRRVYRLSPKTRAKIQVYRRPWDADFMELVDNPSTLRYYVSPKWS